MTTYEDNRTAMMTHTCDFPSSTSIDIKVCKLPVMCYYLRFYLISSALFTSQTIVQNILSIIPFDCKVKVKYIRIDVLKFEI